MNHRLSISPSSTLLARSALLLGAAILAACSGSNSAPDTSPAERAVTATGCPDVSTAAEAALPDAVRCNAEKAAAGGIDGCRAALRRAGDLDEPTLRLAATCVAGSGERTEGGPLAEALNAVHQDGDRLAVTLRVILEVLQPDVHGNSFAAAITRASQTAAGSVADSLPVELRVRLMEVALTYDLRDALVGLTPFVRDLKPDSEALVRFGKLLDASDGYDPFERRAACAAGQWTWDDVVDCFEKKRPYCPDWTGESPLELLGLYKLEDGDPRIPSRISSLLMGGTLAEVEAGAAARWLFTSRYPEKQNHVNALLGTITDPKAAPAIRLAVARAAGPDQCAFESVRTLFRRVYLQEADAARADGSAWGTFVATCTPNWTADESLTALAYGAELVVPEATRNALRERAATGFSTCAEWEGAVDRVVGRITGVPQRWNAQHEAARLAGDKCATAFAPKLLALAKDRNAWPEPRLESIRLLAERGDRSACAELDSVRKWKDPESKKGLDDAMKARADDVAAVCAK